MASLWTVAKKPDAERAASGLKIRSGNGTNGFFLSKLDGTAYPVFPKTEKSSIQISLGLLPNAYG
jgi:hypothetical protein